MSNQSDYTCGHCGCAGPTTHVHDGEAGAHVAHDCAYAGRAYQPDACSGEDLCDECLGDAYTED